MTCLSQLGVCSVSVYQYEWESKGVNEWGSVSQCWSVSLSLWVVGEWTCVKMYFLNSDIYITFCNHSRKCLQGMWHQLAVTREPRWVRRAICIATGLYTCVCVCACAYTSVRGRVATSSLQSCHDEFLTCLPKPKRQIFTKSRMKIPYHVVKKSKPGSIINKDLYNRNWKFFFNVALLIKCAEDVFNVLKLHSAKNII